MQRFASLLLVLVAAGIFAAGAFLYFQGGDSAAQRRGGNAAIPVGVVDAEKQSFADRVQALGTTRADESVTLTADVSDRVVEVHFEDGAFVEEGEVLVELERSEERAELERYRAQLEEAEQQLERTRDLVERGNASEATLDERERNVAEAKAQISGARARVNNRVIRAPFSGILGLREVSPGTLISPGDEITTLDDVTPIKVDFSIPERFLAAIQAGQSVVATAAAYPGEKFRGEIAAVSSRVDPVTRAITVRAKIPNEDAKLRPGMLLTIEVVSRERVAVGIPEEALVPESDNQYVYVVDESAGTVERRAVELGLRRPGIVEIREGLKPGEVIVVSGTQRLRPGAEVRITERGAIPVDRPQA